MRFHRNSDNGMYQSDKGSRFYFSVITACQSQRIICTPPTYDTCVFLSTQSVGAERNNVYRETGKQGEKSLGRNSIRLQNIISRPLPSPNSLAFVCLCIKATNLHNPTITYRTFLLVSFSLLRMPRIFPVQLLVCRVTRRSVTDSHGCIPPFFLTSQKTTLVAVSYSFFAVKGESGKPELFK